MEHSFDIEFAKRYGVIPAIIIKSFEFWIMKNKANDVNFHDGYYWTYNSTKALNELFPYLTTRQINYAIQKLIDEKILITGNYNTMKYDRTLWYAITNFGKSILQNCKMEVTNLENGNYKIVKPIPDTNTDTNTDTKTDINTFAQSKQICTEPPAITLPLNDNSEYPIFQKDIDEWQELYPNTDTMQELRKMKGWLNANPKNRKTRQGIKRFINNWLTKEQDKGRYRQPTQYTSQPKTKQGMTDEEYKQNPF